jgi:hypothetical protein
MDYESARRGTAEAKAKSAQGVREEQRHERERQLQRQSDEEGGLGYQVVRDAAGSDEPLEVLLDREAGRRQKSEEPNRRLRWPTVAQALADAEDHPGNDERDAPDEERRLVAEIRVPGFGVNPHVPLPAGRHKPIRETVSAKPRSDYQRQR